jgi:hypothetical protein
MVQSIAMFMDTCYIAHYIAIMAPALEHFHEVLKKFHELQNIFIKADIHNSILLPCQYALKQFYKSIHLFSSPNGLCSSIIVKRHQSSKRTFTLIKSLSSAHPNALDPCMNG